MGQIGALSRWVNLGIILTHRSNFLTVQIVLKKCGSISIILIKYFKTCLNLDA